MSLVWFLWVFFTRSDSSLISVGLFDQVVTNFISVGLRSCGDSNLISVGRLNQVVTLF